jgi:hypothetical protein
VPGGDRDRAVERLLSTSLSDGPAPLSSACVDAERLAAWADGTLGPIELQTVESHLASCARCQAMAAAFARTAPAAVATAPALRKFRWWMPVAAAAAAVALWVLVPRRATTPAPEMTLAQRGVQPASSDAPSTPAPAAAFPVERNAPAQAPADTPGTRAKATPPPPRPQASESAASNVMLDGNAGATASAVAAPRALPLAVTNLPQVTMEFGAPPSPGAATAGAAAASAARTGDLAGQTQDAISPLPASSMR